MPLRVIIVDDEPLARERVRNCLQDIPEVEVLAECRSGTEALSSIVDLLPDTVFLDVQMPGMTGFEVLRALPTEVAPAIIFTTAHDEFALEAFEVNAVDYLLKPFKVSRFQEAVERARKAAGAGTSVDANRRLATWLDQRATIPAGQRRLTIRTNDRVLFIRFDEIDWIEAAGNYAILHAGRENHIIRETMTHLENNLPAELFFRVSRSAFVHLQRIRELQPMPGGQYVIFLRTGDKVTMTRPLRALQDRLGAT